MSRETKFRGQRIDNGEFVYGDLIHGVGWKKDRMYILPSVHNLASLKGCDPLDGYNVKPETVGQLIGLLNNNPVYEGDKTKEGIIEYNPEVCSYIIRRKNNTFLRLETRKNDIEIVGNIYQPEVVNS